MNKVGCLIQLCEERPADFSRVEDYIEQEALTPREVTAAAYALAQKYQDEIAVFAYENRRAPRS